MPENEPLKGKYEKYAVGLWWDKIANQRLTQEANEVLDDVKSAVEGLLQEIDKKLVQREGKLIKSKYEEGFVDGYKCACHEVIRKIKKWFRDVIP